MKITEYMIDEKHLPEPCREIFDIVAGLTSGAAAKTVLLRFLELHGGSQAYFIMIDTIVRDAWMDRIRADYNGSNVRELASKYNRTCSTIRRILGPIKRDK